MVSVGQIQGSPQWQTALFILAGGYLLWSAVRGWRQGLMRQVMGIFALFAAGFLVLQFTDRLQDLLRSHVPALILIPVSAVLIWIVSFNSIVLIGQLLFRPTRDCQSSFSQLVSGFGGAAIGAGCGLLLVFCVLIGVKIMGRIAANQVEIQQVKNENCGVFIRNLAKLKNSVELGYAGRVIEWMDPIPKRFYQELDQYSRLIADPEALSTSLRRIWVDPQIIEIERDPEIVSDLQRGDILAVCTNRKVAALLNDPQLPRVFAQGDLDAASRSSSNSRDR
jgi:Colicin V production protein